VEVESVPHVVPLPVETQHTGPPSDDELNQQIFDAFTEFVKHVQTVGHGIASDFGISGSDVLALLKLEAPMTMKELGQKMGCDPSFITAIADALERHLLARREPSQRDRRSKNIVLTAEGETARHRLLRELAARAPWCALDTSERQCLLGLLRKMLGPRDGGDCHN
jgi:DNA-binding MarR family transcriptional regulator